MWLISFYMQIGYQLHANILPIYMQISYQLYAHDIRFLAAINLFYDPKIIINLFPACAWTLNVPLAQASTLQVALCATPIVTQHMLSIDSSYWQSMICYFQLYQSHPCFPSYTSWYVGLTSFLSTLAYVCFYPVSSSTLLYICQENRDNQMI
jgi:hypothetical protein